MKKFKIPFLVLALSVGLFSCIKNDPVLFNDAVVEFDATLYNTNNAYTPMRDATLGRLANPLDSVAFPILVRQPAVGRAVTTSDATISRTSGSVRLRVNLVGAPRKSATDVSYTALTRNDYTLIGVASNTNQDAVAGTHYTALPGKVTIPADSSFGYIDIGILNPGTASTVSRELVLKLNGSEDVRPSKNYSVVGIRISQQ